MTNVSAEMLFQYRGGLYRTQSWLDKSLKQITKPEERKVFLASLKPQEVLKLTENALTITQAKQIPRIIQVEKGEDEIFQLHLDPQAQHLSFCAKMNAHINILKARFQHLLAGKDSDERYLTVPPSLNDEQFEKEAVAFLNWEESALSNSRIGGEYYLREKPEINPSQVLFSNLQVELSSATLAVAKIIPYRFETIATFAFV